MKFLNLIIVTGMICASSAFAQDLSDVKRIECARMDDKEDHYVLTPNIYKKGNKVFAALSGDSLHRPSYSGELPFKNQKTDFFYELSIKLINGYYTIALTNLNYQFELNRSLTMTTQDFQTGILATYAFQPGIGGYGPGGIPAGTTQDLIYNCTFIRK